MPRIPPKDYKKVILKLANMVGYTSFGPNCTPEQYVKEKLEDWLKTKELLRQLSLLVRGP